MSISQLARSICESPTLKLNETAARLRDKGEPVIHLGGGEPKSKAPIDAIINCTALLNTGEVRYTPADGIPALKKAVIRYTEENYNRLVCPENVIVSSGAKQAIMVLLYSILEPKDEVIFPVPFWVSYPEMVKLAGGIPVPVRSEDGTFYPRMKEIAEAVGPYTKAIIINSPNNPSGEANPEMTPGPSNEGNGSSNNQMEGNGPAGNQPDSNAPGNIDSSGNCSGCNESGHNGSGEKNSDGNGHGSGGNKP